MTIEDLRTYQKTKQTIQALEAELRAVYAESPKPNDNPGGKSSVRTSSDPTAIKAQKAIQIREKLENNGSVRKILQSSLCVSRIRKSAASSGCITSLATHGSRPVRRCTDIEIGGIATGRSEDTSE